VTRPESNSTSPVYSSWQWDGPPILYCFSASTSLASCDRTASLICYSIAPPDNFGPPPALESLRRESLPSPSSLALDSCFRPRFSSGQGCSVQMLIVFPETSASWPLRASSQIFNSSFYYFSELSMPRSRSWDPQAKPDGKTEVCPSPSPKGCCLSL